MKQTSSIGLALILGLTTLNPGAEGTWTRKADMPMARTLCGAATVNGKIYVIGGGRSWYESSPPTAVYICDPATDTWEVRADMPTPRVTVAAVALDGKIYAVGGVRGQTALRTLEVYDPETDTWEKKADMQTARAWLGAVGVDGKIYAVGGWPSMASMEMYDPVIDTWTPRSNMPAGRHVFGIGAVDGKIYVIGGEGGASTASPNVFEYDPIADRWTEQAEMPSGRYCQSTGVVNGKIYVFGGDSVHGGGGPGLSVVEVYDPVTNTWSKGPDMLGPRTETTAAVVDGRIYVIGGSARSGGQPLSVVEEYDPNPITVDFNYDGIVDSKDVCMMIDYWGTGEQLYDIAPQPSGDGVVDVQDLALLAEYLFQQIDDPTLVAHWAFDEPEGAIAFDSVGDNIGYVMGDPTWQPDAGKIDGAIDLDGLDDAVIPGSPLNPADGPFSALVWVKGGGPGQAVISEPAGPEWLSLDPHSGFLMTELVGSGRGASFLVSATAISDGNWHRIGFVWDGAIRTLLVDGIVVAQDSQNGLQSPSDGFYIGTGKAMAPGTYFSGLIDDVRIYKTALTADKIVALSK